MVFGPEAEMISATIPSGTFFPLASMAISLMSSAVIVSAVSTFSVSGKARLPSYTSDTSTPSSSTLTAFLNSGIVMP